MPPRPPPNLMEMLVKLYELPYTWMFFIILRLRESAYRLVYYSLCLFFAVILSCALVLRQMMLICLVLMGFYIPYSRWLLVRQFPGMKSHDSYDRIGWCFCSLWALSVCYYSVDRVTRLSRYLFSIAKHVHGFSWAIGT